MSRRVICFSTPPFKEKELSTAEIRFYEIAIFRFIDAPCIALHLLSFWYQFRDRFQVYFPRVGKQLASDKNSKARNAAFEKLSSTQGWFWFLIFGTLGKSDKCRGNLEAKPKSRKNDQRRWSVTIRAEFRKCEVFALRAAPRSEPVYPGQAGIWQLIFQSLRARLFLTTGSALEHDNWRTSGTRLKA